MTTQQPDALIPDEKTVMAQAQVYASTWAIVGSRFDAGDGLELAEQEKTILADMVRRLGARIIELESQLAQRFDAADMATAAAQGFRDGVASVSAGSEPEAWREHVEQRLLAWRQSFVYRSGDQLALEDFMDKQSLDDLIYFVCDEWALNTRPSPQEGMVMAPKVPTAEMKAAAVKYANGTAVYKNVKAEVLRIEEDIYGEVYEAMIAAAPGPADGESNV